MKHRFNLWYDFLLPILNKIVGKKFTEREDWYFKLTQEKGGIKVLSDFDVDLESENNIHYKYDWIKLPYSLYG